MKFLKIFLFRSFFVVMLSMGFMSVELADNNDHGFANPTELGRYKIGHTTMLLTDPTRNQDGSSSSTPQGRPLFVHILYPSEVRRGSLAQYSENNPIYDGTHLGYPQVIFSVYLPSTNGALDGVPVAEGTFPLLIYSHGSDGSAGFAAAAGLLETLASHGYIVAAVEHTGNNRSRVIANILGLPSPGMSDGPTRLIRRSQDVRFVITQMLDSTANPLFSQRINPDEIGLFGYSFGGGTTMVTVAGVGLAGVAPDPRVKAAVAMDGTDYVGFSANDYANVKVPLMLYQDGDGQNQAVFPQLVNSYPKYYADVSAALHISAAYPILCNALHRSFVKLESTPEDAVTLIQLLLEYSNAQSDIFAECDASIFRGISDQTITNIGADLTEVQAMKPFMPLRKEVSLDKLYRLSKWYVVSFFNKELKHQDVYAGYLTDSKGNQKVNPLVDFAKNCRQVPDHLMDLRNGDKITFTPVGNRYKVGFSSGNPLLDQGVNNLNLGDDDQVSVSLPFSFSMPNVGMVDKINVTSNGAITISALTQRPGFEAFGSPWMLRGEMLLNGQTTIAPLMNDLDPTAGGGIYAKIENKRVVVTWDAVPVYTNAGNGAPSTIQVVIYKNGTIEMIFGDLANTGQIISRILSETLVSHPDTRWLVNSERI